MAALAASDDDADNTCFICLEPHSASQRLLHGGCGCRGSSGFGHVACVAKAAQEMNTSMWQYCPTCKQSWIGQMQLGWRVLASHRWRRGRRETGTGWTRATC
jgi:hypothetical protein